MKDIILIGKQGSGKGTQAQILAKNFDYLIFETGKKLREITLTDSELGRKVKEITTRGDLVPNDIVMEIVQYFLKNTSKDIPIIFDGIPRSQNQLETLDMLLQNMGREYQVLNIEISDKEAFSRLGKRVSCSDCGHTFGKDICPKCGSTKLSRRADDVPVAIQKRLDNFQKHTAPLVEIWKQRNVLIVIDGESTEEEVANNTFLALGLK